MTAPRRRWHNPMSPINAACAIALLFVSAIGGRAAEADGPADQPAAPAPALVEITIDQAKEMILDFISAEEAKQKNKAGGNSWVIRSRSALEKQEMVRIEQTGTLIWGAWQVYPDRGVAVLRTRRREGGDAWEVIAQIKQVHGKYRLTDPRTIEIRGLRCATPTTK